MKVKLSKSSINAARHYAKTYGGRIVGASIYRDAYTGVSRFGTSRGMEYKLALLLSDGAVVDIASGGKVEELRVYGAIATEAA